MHKNDIGPKLTGHSSPRPFWQKKLSENIFGKKKKNIITHGIAAEIFPNFMAKSPYFLPRNHQCFF